MKKVEMIEKGKFSLNGMTVTKYSEGQILGDETPDRVKEYFLKIESAVEIESKIEAKEKPVVKPTETKVIKPEVKKGKNKK